MHRFFTDSIISGRAEITGEDVRHIGRVLRLRRGDAVQVCDGNGRDYDGSILEVTDQSVTVSLSKAYPSAGEPLHRVTLFQCLPKTGKMETIVQKCTELGVSALVPVVSKRCVAQPGGNFENKRVRYQKVAEEAAKQSRRGCIPRVGPVLPIDRIEPAGFDLTVLAYEEEENVTLKALLKTNRAAEKIALIIGPEGGFAPEEVACLQQKGAKIVTLGNRILRTETAGMATIAMLLYDLEK